MTQFTLPLITVAALIDSINPCAISVLLLTIGFLASLKKSPMQIRKITLLYIIGIYLVYFLIGIGILGALTLFGLPKAISKIGAVIIIISGIISLSERFIPSFPIHLSLPSFSKPSIAKLISRATLPASFALGIFVGLFEFPCTGGPYLFILSLLHDSATQISGSLYLAYYNLIFVSPLLIITLLATNAHLNKPLTDWRQRNSAAADIISSIIMILLGLVIFLL